MQDYLTDTDTEWFITAEFSMNPSGSYLWFRNHFMSDESYTIAINFNNTSLSGYVSN